MSFRGFYDLKDGFKQLHLIPLSFRSTVYRLISSIERNILEVRYITEVLKAVLEDPSSAGACLHLIEQRHVVLEVLHPPRGLVAPMKSNRCGIVIDLLDAEVTYFDALVGVVKRLLAKVLAQERFQLSTNLHEGRAFAGPPLEALLHELLYGFGTVPRYVQHAFA